MSIERHCPSSFGKLRSRYGVSAENVHKRRWRRGGQSKCGLHKAVANTCLMKALIRASAWQSRDMRQWHLNVLPVGSPSMWRSSRVSSKYEAKALITNRPSWYGLRHGDIFRATASINFVCVKPPLMIRWSSSWKLRLATAVLACAAVVCWPTNVATGLLV